MTTTTTSPARELIARLEAIGQEQDELHQRLLDNLRGYAEAAEDLLIIEEAARRTAANRCAVIVESAMTLHEATHHETLREALLRRRTVKQASVH